MLSVASPMWSALGSSPELCYYQLKKECLFAVILQSVHHGRNVVEFDVVCTVHHIAMSR